VTFIYVFVQAARGKITWRVAIPFAINLIANLLFTTIEFTLRNLPLASLDILVVLATIVWMIVAVWPHYRWVAIAHHGDEWVIANRQVRVCLHCSEPSK
jgi:tryptophan-rich sensory protein